MARNNHIVNSLVGGEASPRFYGRSDTNQYNNCAEDIKNWVVLPQGGAKRRTGSRFVGAIYPDPTLFLVNKARGFPFTSSDGRKYSVVVISYEDVVNPGLFTFGVRIYNCNNLEEVSAIDGSNLGSSYVRIFGATDLDQCQYSQSGDTLIITNPRAEPLVIQKLDASLYGQDAFVANQFHAFAGSQLGNNYDSFAFFELQRDGVTSGASVSVTSTGGSNYSLLASSDLFDSDMARVTGGKQGAIFKFSNPVSGNTLVVEITAVTNSVLATATSIGGTLSASPTDFGPNGATGSFYEVSAWNYTYGFPRTISFFEGRLVFGGVEKFPDTVWFSRINNIYKFAASKLLQDPTFTDPVSASDPFSITLKGNQVSSINFLIPGTNITAGTNSREFIVQGPDTRAGISITNVQSRAETPHGSVFAQAVNLENTTVFIQKDGKSLRELVYTLDENSFQAADLNIIAEHISQKGFRLYPENGFIQGQGGFRRIDIQQVPDQIVWAIDTVGRLYGLTRARDQQVAAWHYHELAGQDGAFIDILGEEYEYPPNIIDIWVQSADIASNTLTSGSYFKQIDELWMLVKRPYNESGTWVTRLSVEKLSNDFLGNNIGSWIFLDPTSEASRLEDAPIYVDMATVHDSSDYTGGVITGLPYNEDDEVDVVCNGHYFGKFTVDGSNSIDISSELAALGITIWKAIVGFNYVADLIPMVPEVPASLGSSLGQKRRVDQLGIHLYRSLGLKIGIADAENRAVNDSPRDSLDELVFPLGATMSDPRPLFTGLMHQAIQPMVDRRPRIKLQSHLPFPCEITHIVMRMVVNE